MKKILIITASILMLMTLASCKKKPEPEPEVIVHDYYFQDYVDVKVLGASGQAVIKYYPKEFDVKDFKSEDDYIKMRKVMNVLINNIAFSKNEGISNGETILMAPNSKFKLTESVDVCLDPVEIAITDLPEITQIDLFGPNVVNFYGLDDTNQVVYEFPKINDLPQEILNNLNYKISLDTTKVEENSTVMKIKAEMNTSYIKEFDCSTTEEFFIVKGYKVETSTEKVLRINVNPIDFTSNNKSAIHKALTEKMKEYCDTKGLTFYELASVQQSRYANDPYTYKVGSIIKGKDEKVCAFMNVEMVELPESIHIEKIDGGTKKSYENCYTTEEDWVIKTSWSPLEEELEEEVSEETLDDLVNDLQSQLDETTNTQDNN